MSKIIIYFFHPLFFLGQKGFPNYIFFSRNVNFQNCFFIFIFLFQSRTCKQKQLNIFGFNSKKPKKNDEEVKAKSFAENFKFISSCRDIFLFKNFSSWRMYGWNNSSPHAFVRAFQIFWSCKTSFILFVLIRKTYKGKVAYQNICVN